MNRRHLLKTLGAAAWLPLSSRTWAALTPAAPARKRLVVVFMRGAVDGLNVVIPVTDGRYHDARPNIAIAEPGRPGGALALDTRFGLHPALAPLMPLWNARQLSFVHASGMAAGTRSHFEAQDLMETAVPQRSADGWLNRLLAVLPSDGSAVQGLNLGESVPRILTGPAHVASLPLGRGATRPIALDRANAGAAFDQMYSGDDPLSQAYREGRSARGELMGSMSKEQMAADNGAPDANGYPQDAKRLAHLMRENAGIQIAFTAVGGWDTHVNQGGADQGRLQAGLKPFGEGLAALSQGLGPAADDTVIVVMSEFGRTFKENGNGGTDHGHGNVMWLLGKPVAGGRVHAEWPGLAQNQLHESRDLAVTTDYRAVIHALLTQHLKLNAEQVQHVLPDFKPASPLPLIAST